MNQKRIWWLWDDKQNTNEIAKFLKLKESDVDRVISRGLAAHVAKKK